jgi:hypothetical protein
VFGLYYNGKADEGSQCLERINYDYATTAIGAQAQNELPEVSVLYLKYIVVWEGILIRKIFKTTLGLGLAYH